jgi:hypothetical protein
VTFAAKLAQVRAGLMQQGWLPCQRRGCTNLVAPLPEGERGPTYCAACELMRDQLKRGA